MMYAIVHKNRVVLGPLAWAQKYFTDVLKIRHRVQANIPAKCPENLPYKIDENTSIHEVIENRPEIDAMVQQHYGPLWDTSGDTVVANYEVVDLDIDSARNNFRNLAAHERYKKEISGVKISLQGVDVTVDTARTVRDIAFHKYLLMEESAVVAWKFPECWLNLTKSELHEVVQKIESHVQGCFDTERTVNLLISEAQTAEELYAAIEVIQQKQTTDKEVV